MFLLVKRIVSLIVGLFFGQAAYSFLSLFQIAGFWITLIFVGLLLVVFAMLNWLWSLERNLLFRGIRTMTRSDVTNAEIEQGNRENHLDAKFIVLGATTGGLVSAFWSPTFLSDLLPF